MKRVLSLSAVFSLVVCSTVNAASLRVHPSFSPTGIYSVYVNGGTDNGNFDTLIVDIKPDAPALFLNPNSGNEPGVGPRPAGQPFTYINRMINASPDDVPGGLGWTVLGLAPTAELANGLSFTTGPLGSTINTSGMLNGELFLVNFMIPAGASATGGVQLVSAGTVLRNLPLIDIPEPTTAGLASLALVGLAAARRRWA
jgi:hypothetical protein